MRKEPRLPWCDLTSVYERSCLRRTPTGLFATALFSGILIREFLYTILYQEAMTLGRQHETASLDVSEIHVLREPDSIGVLSFEYISLLKGYVRIRTI